MAIVQTDLRQTIESARRIRFEPMLPVTAVNVQDAINQVSAIAQSIPTSINFASSPYQVLLSDRVLLVDTSGGAVTINMMAGSTRNGSDLTIKDDTGHAVANPISVVLNGAETVDGLAPYPIDSNFAAVRFVPQAGGYYVAP